MECKHLFNEWPFPLALLLAKKLDMGEKEKWKYLPLECKQSQYKMMAFRLVNPQMEQQLLKAD